MATEAKRKANAKYDKSHTQSVMLKLNKQTDADVIAMLKSVDNRQGYIKSLIRDDLRGKGDPITVEAISFLIQPVARKYGLDKVYLFGSYARGEATTESDVDLSIEGGEYKGIFGLLELQEAFKTAIGRDVDVVEAKAIENNNTRSGRRFRQHLERDKVLIYERS